MDFRRVLGSLVEGFRAKDIDYALIGGFALALWGVSRATVDLDFLVPRDRLPGVDEVMTHLGYELRYRTENVSQFVSPDRQLGAVDFLHAFRSASAHMLAAAVERAAFDGALRVRVLRPEDLVGLKVQALKKDPRREVTDAAQAADEAVEFLVQYNAFVSHEPKPFRPIADHDMRL